MDNESFRYLAAVKTGVQFDEEEDRIFAASWDKARYNNFLSFLSLKERKILLRSETDRLMDHVSTLHPHRVKDTVSINDVRRRILDLTKPLAEIAKRIDITIDNFADHQKEIADTEASADDIRKMINIQVIRCM